MTVDHELSTQLERLISFFYDNIGLLRENYPGINKRIFKDFLLKELDRDLLANPNELIELFNKGVPLSYISKKRFFYNMEFYVDKRVLIPRFETEILVHDAISLIKKNKLHSVLDVGAGAGTIILTILKELRESEVELEKAIASDICPEALEILKKNATINKLENSLTLIQSDRFEIIDSTFDMIVSNPPYIKLKADLDGVHTKTYEFEPHKALFLPDKEYCSWFKSFFNDVLLHLNSGGYFLMEGHEDHLEELTCHLKESALKSNVDLSLKVVKDLSGVNRFIYCQKLR